MVYWHKKEKNTDIKIEKITDDMIKNYNSDIAKELKSAKTSNEKFEVFQKVVSTLHNGLKLYENTLSKDQKTKQKSKLRIAKIVLMGVSMETDLFTNGFKKDITYAQYEVVKDFGSAVIGELAGEIPEMIALKSKSVTLRGVKKAVGAVLLGYNIGNKIIHLSSTD